MLAYLAGNHHVALGLAVVCLHGSRALSWSSLLPSRPKRRFNARRFCRSSGDGRRLSLFLIHGCRFDLQNGLAFWRVAQIEPGLPDGAIQIEQATLNLIDELMRALFSQAHRVGRGDLCVQGDQCVVYALGAR